MFLGELVEHLAHHVVHDALVVAEIVEERLKGRVSDLQLGGREVEPVGDLIRPDQVELVVGHERAQGN